MWAKVELEARAQAIEAIFEGMSWFLASFGT